MKHVFAVRQKFREALARRRQLREDIKQIAAHEGGQQYCRFLRLAGDPDQGESRYEEPALDDIIARLRTLSPYCCVCPKCYLAAETDEGCPSCFGLDWVPVAVIRATPQPLVDAVKKLAATEGGEG